MLIDQDRVIRFWKWFNTISGELLKQPADDRLIKQIDHYISSIGQELDWEIGPVELDMHVNADARYYLAISPCLNEELLNKTQEIIALAPACKGWVFFPSKPAKGWTGNWNMQNELGSIIAINANEWKYTLYQFEDKTFDMDIWVNKVDGNLSTKHIAVDIGITNLLGEERFMKEIKHVTIIEEEGATAVGNWTLLKNLEKHLNTIK